MITPDDLNLLGWRLHRRQLLEEHLGSLEKIWPSTHRWEWSPDRALDRNIGDDWVMDFRDDCAEAIAHVEASNLPKFVKLACNVVDAVHQIMQLTD